MNLILNLNLKSQLVIIALIFFEKKMIKIVVSIYNFLLQVEVVINYYCFNLFKNKIRCVINNYVLMARKHILR